MSKKVLILSSSPRENSNSHGLAEAFYRGAVEAGHEAELIDLRELDYGFCKGCLACQKTHRCVLKDGIADVVQKVGEAEVLAFATPVYYYSISGQLKTFLDRCNPLYGSDPAFRDVYLLATAAEDEPTTVRGAVKTLQGWVDCFEHAELTGVIFAGNMDRPGAIREHPALLDAFEKGKAV